jgi:PAS domain S-box-containing protein
MSALGLLNAVFLVLPILIAAYLGVYAWRRRALPGAISFLWCMILIAAWCGTSLMVVISLDPQQAVFWVRAMLAVVPFFPALILATVIQTSVRQITLPKTSIALFIVPTITAILTLTSGSQNLYLYNIGLVKSGAQNVGWTNQYGPWSAVHLSYSYAMVAFAIILLVRQFIRLRYHTYRMRVFLLSLGFALPFVTNIVNTLLSSAHYFITPIMFNVASPIFFWALFRYRLFELLPVGRDRAFEQMDDAIIIIDVENRIFDINPNAAALAGHPANALLEKSLFTGFPSFESSLSPLLGSLVNHQSNTMQRQASPRYFDVTISPITHDEEPIGKLIILHDMTEQRQIELRARQLEMERERIKSLSAFIEAASHEFRTPLSIIKSSTFIVSRSDDAAKRAEKITQIDDQANRISQLVDALLNVMRLNTDVDLNLDPLNINTVVEKVKTDVSEQAAAKNIHLDLDLAPDLPPLKADATYLPNALHEVANNAIQNTSSGGTVTLTTCQRDSQIIITVKDTGIGISPDELPHIFDVFYRVDKARTTAGFGTGLTIASRIISLHGGHIEAASQLGEGTTITISLPLEGKTLTPQPV